MRPKARRRKRQTEETREKEKSDFIKLFLGLEVGGGGKEKSKKRFLLPPISFFLPIFFHG